MSDAAAPAAPASVLAEPSAPAAAPASPAPAAPAAPEWIAGLPEGMRADPVLSRYASVEALAKGHIEAQGLIGRKGLIAPKEGDPAEVQQAWRQALGVPEKPDGYEIKAPEGTTPEHWNDDTTTVLRNWAHDLGLTPQQAQGLAERYAGMLNEAAAQQFETAQATMRKEWGAAYDRKVSAGNAAVREFFGDAGTAALKAAGLLNNPDVIRALATIGERVGNHDGAAGMGAGPAPMTPAEARAKAAELRRSKDYFSHDPRVRQPLVQRALELEKMATVGQG